MSKTRVKTNLIHKKNGQEFEISRDKKTGTLFIKNTYEAIAPDKVTRTNKNKKQVSSNYDFNKPGFAQDLGDEWSDYAWSADDF